MNIWILSISVTAILGRDFGAHSALLEEGNLFLCGIKPREITLCPPPPPPFFDAVFLTTKMVLSNSAFQFSE